MEVLTVIGAVLGIVGGILGVIAFVRGEIRASREHKWRAAEVAEEDARAEWCQDVVERLKYRRTPGTRPAVDVPADRLAWARWGEHQKLFRVQELHDRWIATGWYDD